MMPPLAYPLKCGTVPRFYTSHLPLHGKEASAGKYFKYIKKKIAMAFVKG